MSDIAIYRHSTPKQRTQFLVFATNVAYLVSYNWNRKRLSCGRNILLQIVRKIPVKVS